MKDPASNSTPVPQFVPLKSEKSNNDKDIRALG